MRHGHTGHPAFPAQWFIRLLRAHPGDGLFCHRHLRDLTHKLDTSVEMSGPHDLAVRLGIARLARRRVPPQPIPR